jgi:hypothetical protein
MATIATVCELDATFFCHTNNLDQKRRTALTERARSLLDNLIARYESFVATLDYSVLASGNLDASVESLDEYITAAKEAERTDPCFNWRTDYCGSIIPEFIYRVLHATLYANHIPALFSTRESVVELTISGGQDGGWEVRRKNQDLSIGLRRESVTSGGESQSFVVPVVAMEVKTNIDINKLNGLDFSAERLKRTFPSSQYLLVTETIDFSLHDNYASGSIDEVYVLRKQLRSRARRSRGRLHPDVFAQLVADILAVMKTEVAMRGHVYERLATGKLIHASAS